MVTRSSKIVLGSLLLFFLCGAVSSVLGQVKEDAVPEIITPKRQPPMQNVFWNVLWGAAVGGTLNMGWATIDDSREENDRYTVSHLSNQFLVGGTYGAFIGLIAGVYLSVKGVTFDEGRGRLALLPIESPEPRKLQLYSNSVTKQAGGKLHLANLQIRF